MGESFDVVIIGSGLGGLLCGGILGKNGYKLPFSKKIHRLEVVFRVIPATADYSIPAFITSVDLKKARPFIRYFRTWD